MTRSPHEQQAGRPAGYAGRPYPRPSHTDLEHTMTTDPRARALAEAVHAVTREKATRLPVWAELSLPERQSAVADARLWLRAAVRLGLVAPTPEQAELPDPAAARCICGHTQAQHFEDVCITEITGCDCGDFLTPEAAREVIARYQGAMDRVRTVLETEAVVGRSALEYRGLIASALMAGAAPAATRTDATDEEDDPPAACWHTEPGTPCDWDVCRQPERLAAGDRGTDTAGMPSLGPKLRAAAEQPEPDSPPYARLKAAAKEATEASHLHAMRGMRAVYQLCRQYGFGDERIRAAEVLAALGLDENATPIEPAAGARQSGPPCGNNPNYQLTPGDQKVVDQFRTYLTDLKAGTVQSALRCNQPEGEHQAHDWEPVPGKTVRCFGEHERPRP